jgi:hypothetical protein
MSKQTAPKFKPGLRDFYLMQYKHPETGTIERTIVAYRGTKSQPAAPKLSFDEGTHLAALGQNEINTREEFEAKVRYYGGVWGIEHHWQEGFGEWLQRTPEQPQEATA